MIKYVVLKDYSAGYIPNVSPPQPNIVVKSGDVVEGDLKTQLLGDAAFLGLSVSKPNGTVFIKREDLRPYQADRTGGQKNDTTTGETKKEEADGKETKDTVVFKPSVTPIIYELTPMVFAIIGGGLGYYKEGDYNGMVKYAVIGAAIGLLPLGVYQITKNSNQKANAKQ